jgi:hypothetical protein
MLGIDVGETSIGKYMIRGLGRRTLQRETPSG